MKIAVNTSAFVPSGGGTGEFHSILRVTDPSLPFAGQLEAVLDAYRDVSSGQSVHFRRIFLSDAANQAALVLERLAGFPEVPTSIVQQEPLDGSKIAMWVYCTSPMEGTSGALEHNGYCHRWSGTMVSPGAGSLEQMDGIFRRYDSSLRAKGLSVAEDTVRTWIFVRDVDTNYAGVVKGRREYFKEIGLTADTHFIASTGIEGRNPDWRNIVEMDAYAVGGLKKGQLNYLYAPENLSSTSIYGVTFERGASVTYGDRRHVFISGTASIDSKGEVLHQGNPAAQAGRMLENVEALLKEAGAGFGDIVVAVVYLRDPSDYPAVKAIVSEVCPGINAVYVHAPVCRPSWLVEMECMAVTSRGNGAFRNY